MDFKLHNGSGGLCCKSCGRQDKQLNTYDWLADIPGNADESELVEVQFKNTRKGYFRNSNKIPLEKGDIVAVEATPGHDIGVVTLTGRLVPLQMKKANIKSEADIKRIYRKAKPVDMEKYNEAKAREHSTMIRSRQIALDLNLNMKIGDVEYQGDGNKAIFYYIADERVDFRQLIKVLARRFSRAYRDETDWCPPGSRTHRRYRSLRTRAVLRHLDDLLRIGIHQRGALPGHFTESAEACRTMRQTEVLPQLRSRLLRGSTETPALTRDYPGNQRRRVLLLQSRHSEQPDNLLERQEHPCQPGDHQRQTRLRDYRFEQTWHQARQPDRRNPSFRTQKAGGLAGTRESHSL